MNFKGINYDRVIYKTYLNKGKLLFYSVKYTTSQNGIGLVFIENKFLNNLVISNSKSLTKHVTWDILTIPNRDDKIDIIYGTTDSNVEKLLISINDKFYEPEFIQTEFKTIWYLVFNNITGIQSIKAFNNDGVITYRYPPK